MSSTDDTLVGSPARLPERQTATRQTIERRSLHNEVTERLRDMIIEGELPPGQRIDEGELCRLLGISRTPLREAIKVLASEGLIELRPNRGTRVTKMTLEDVAELFEVVGGIERLAGELAAERMSDGDIEHLRQMQERLERLHAAARRHDYFRLNQDIHNSIVALAGNSVLAATHAGLMIKVRRARYTAILSQERWDESVREHAAILEALAAREPARAGALIAAHVAKTGDVITSSFDPEA